VLEIIVFVSKATAKDTCDVLPWKHKVTRMSSAHAI